MAKDLILRKDELVENPTARIAVCLVLDASGSMEVVVEGSYTEIGKTQFEDGREWKLVEGGVTKLDKLNEGLQQFFREIMENEMTRYSAEVAIVTFAGNAETIMDFQTIDNDCLSLKIKKSELDGTHIGEAAGLALANLDKRKEDYKRAGVGYYQPWLVLMTDGHPTDDSHTSVAPEVAKRVNERKLVVFPIGIGNNVNQEVLSMFSPNRVPLKLKGLKFKEFFEWLSKSIVAVSESTPGDKVELDTKGINDWAEKGWGTL